MNADRCDQDLFLHDSLPDPLKENGASLGTAALEHFARHGWVASKHFFTAQGTADIARFTDELCALPERAGAHMIYRETSLLDPNVKVIQRIENFCRVPSGFDALIRGGRLQRAVEEFLDGPACSSKTRSISRCPAVAASKHIKINKRVGPSTRRCSSRRWSPSI